ncbi:hypothetical protein VP1G_01840 [Cytospora mali]|uniref:N-acetyltransferase domain-containing protein n=1 Tax=Cytospora mali TaxID=578113 RepID=A0A194URX8_CYTMA|nr:hypothetical protein VP1G_01840 [Valsa mali var. pyri (nom. inval.)]
MSSTTSTFTFSPVVPVDVPALTEISGLGFANDRHTLLKTAHPTRPYDHAGGMPESFEYWRSLPPGKLEVTKAVDNETGQIMGFVCWATKLNKPDGQSAQQKETQDASTADGNAEGPERKPKLPASATPPDYVKTTSPDLDPLGQLEELTSAHFADFQKRMMPEGTRCMYVVGITVHPKFQGRGVGEALMRLGTQRADAEGVFCWVHSSEDGYALYRKCGFEIADTLEIDLDEWARKMDIKPPMGDEKWGKYTFRYMVRQPKAA